MDTSLINELFRLLYKYSRIKSDNFVSIFEDSRSIAAFSYNQKTKRFTEFSKSTKALLGYKNIFLLTDSSVLRHLIHPADLPSFNKYFNSIFFEKKHKIYSTPELFVKQFDCRMRHVKGYWKQLIFFSLEHTDISSNIKHKIGIMAEEEINNHNYIEIANHPNKEFIISSYNTIINQVSVTSREHEILELIGRGLITKEIANKLNISDTTVISHRKNLINKFKVKNTAELIRQASKLMLI